MRTCPALLTALLLAGCSSVHLPGSSREPTIGSLEAPQLPDAPRQQSDNPRKAAIQHYQAFLDESPENVFVPEAMRRLADLYLADEQDALGEGQAVAGSTSRAAQLYAQLLKRYPDHKRNDTALYQLARAYEQSGETEPAMQALSHYADKYSENDKYDEAQFRRGEYLFVRRQFRDAEAAYQAVLDTGADSDFHQQALYKLGWARFKQNDYESALHAYISLLDEILGAHDSTELPDGLARADQERLDDTLRAVSLSFSYLGDTKSIQGYFSRQGNKPYEPLLYARLAGLHLSKERYSDAADTYRLFAEAHPQHREAPLFQSRVIDVYKKAGFGARVLEEKQAFVERYQPAGNYWQQHNPEDSPDVLNQVQRHLRDVAEHYHAQAQQQKKPAAYTEAGRWYRLFLSAFPASKQAPYMNFLYAELLTSAGSHGEAALQYERTAYNYGEHEKAAESGYAALLAYRKHESALQGRKRTDWHLAGITSALHFATKFPGHKQALPVRTLAAQQLYALKDYQGAIAAALPVTENPRATTALSLSAWTVIAHSRFDLQDYLKAEAAYQEVLARTPNNDEKRNALQEKLAASIYKQGEQARSSGDLAAAAGHFLRIASAVPRSPINVTAQYDAAAAYIALKRWPDAIRILEPWRKANPKHKLQPDVTRKLAVLYRENGQPVLAAGEFERIASTEKDPALRREARLTTASLYQQAGRGDRAIEAYKRFIKEFPQPVEPAMEAQYQLVQLYDKAGQADRKLYWQGQLVKSDRAAGKQRTDRTRYLAAHARLALVAGEQTAYRQVLLKEPLKKSLAKKKKHMKAAIKGYTEAAAYKVAEVSTEATFRIGKIYQDFGAALMTSERPRNLNEEELEQYEILLEEQAYPFEEKAIEIHETNAQRTTDGLYDAWVRKSLAELAELMPVRYAKQEKGEDFVAVLQ
ncbi:TolA-binding protein [Thiogranum longum]|uniref:TolA-binding protein n=1 Tax=Thiogranum longum TaxID=1537524 RepID=A0A4R1H9A3_9GAMM|nr:tetratricopeptide repeat protein [Thiogranum longum]TCK17053.1 TolA-binding protein [Thiogranum longum]